MTIEKIKQPIQDYIAVALSSGETLLAIVPISDILSEDGISSIKDIEERAIKLPDQILKRCKAFLSEPEFKPIKLGLKKIDYLDLIEDISKVRDVNWLAKKLDGIEDQDLKDGFATIIGNTITFLRGNIPKLPVSITSKSSRPADFLVSRFNRVFRTVDDPMTILRDLEQGCLSREQVQTLQRVYPSLYELIKNSLVSTAIEITSKNKEFEVPYNKLKQISVLMLSSTVLPDLQSLLQQNFSSEDQATSGGDINISKNMETNMQRISNK